MIVCLAIAACSSAPPPRPSVAAITASETRDVVRVSLSLEGAPLSGSLSWASARVENLGPKPVRWAGGGCGDPVSLTIDLRAAFARGREWPGLLGRFKVLALGNGPIDNPAAGFYIAESRIGTQVLCPADLRIEELAAGAALSLRAAWNGMVADDAPAPAGPATVTASFPFIGITGTVGDDATATTPIVVRIDTTVRGGTGTVPLSPAIAIDAALADPQFAAWVEAGTEASWINPIVGLQAGTWTIGLFRHGGDDESELFGSVAVDSTGKVTGHRFDPRQGIGSTP
jgi:hypothetical protein